MIYISKYNSLASIKANECASDLNKVIDQLIAGMKHVKFNGWEDIIQEKIMGHKHATSFYHLFRFGIQFVLIIIATMTPYIIIYVLILSLRFTDGRFDLPEAYFLISLVSIINFPVRLMSSGLTMMRNVFADLKTTD